MTSHGHTPEHQRSTQNSAFGNFVVAQGEHLFSRGDGAGIRADVREVAPRTYFIQPGMVNVALFETDEGLLMVDCGCAGDGPALLAAVREISDKPLHTVVYTHGHVDHAFGLWAFLDAGERPRIIAHENLPAHFERYMKTAGLNASINRQRTGTEGKSWPSERDDFVWPDTTFADELTIELGGESFVLCQGKGETDDCAWVWAPGRGVIAAGDLVTGYLGNAGNPKKVQRYAEEWAQAADVMATLAASVIIPGHGEPVIGSDEVRDELSAISRYMRHIVDHALAGLNAGSLPDEIVASLVIPDDLAEHPRLRAIYDKPEFICRNVIRRYGGWWNGHLADLLPAPRPQLAAELARLMGGVQTLVARADELADDDVALAAHLAELAFQADPTDADARRCYVEVFTNRAAAEPALMAKAIFGESRNRAAVHRP